MQLNENLIWNSYLDARQQTLLWVIHQELLCRGECILTLSELASRSKRDPETVLIALDVLTGAGIVSSTPLLDEGMGLFYSLRIDAGVLRDHQKFGVGV